MSITWETMLHVLYSSSAPEQAGAMLMPDFRNDQPPRLREDHINPADRSSLSGLMQTIVGAPNDSIADQTAETTRTASGTEYLRFPLGIVFAITVDGSNGGPAIRAIGGSHLLTARHSTTYQTALLTYCAGSPAHRINAQIVIRLLSF